MSPGEVEARSRDRPRYIHMEINAAINHAAGRLFIRGPPTVWHLAIFAVTVRKKSTLRNRFPPSLLLWYAFGGMTRVHLTSTLRSREKLCAGLRPGLGALFAPGRGS
ncbi:unnamed protein product, partial [Iphiclides podalirius]